MQWQRRRTRAGFARRLRGEGLEIGALVDPLPVPHATRIVYSDLLTAEQIAALYPGSRLPDIVSDSESFPSIANETFDFVVANHVLEHLTDPIGALREWHRILKNDGLLMLALPDKRFTFDAPRARTPLAHLIEDHRSADPPHVRNRMHLDEWATHVEQLAEGSAERKVWIEKQLQSGYAVHNHVWIAADLVELLEWMNRETTAHWALERLANTSPFTNEFILLLRRSHEAPGKLLSRLELQRLRLSDPLVGFAAAIKRALRGSSLRRFSARS